MKKIVAYKGSFEELYNSLPQKDKDKVDRVLLLMQSDNKMPSHFIDYEDGKNTMKKKNSNNFYDVTSHLV